MAARWGDSRCLVLLCVQTHRGVGRQLAWHMSGVRLRTPEITPGVMWPCIDTTSLSTITFLDKNLLS